MILNPKIEKSPYCGRGDTPLPHPPPARSLCSLVFVILIVFTKYFFGGQNTVFSLSEYCFWFLKVGISEVGKFHGKTVYKSDVWIYITSIWDQNISITSVIKVKIEVHVHVLLNLIFFFCFEELSQNNTLK